MTKDDRYLLSSDMNSPVAKQIHTNTLSTILFLPTVLPVSLLSLNIFGTLYASGVMVLYAVVCHPLRANKPYGDAYLLLFLAICYNVLACLMKRIKTGSQFNNYSA